MDEFPPLETFPGPFWHDQNPWKDELLYVPVVELAACHMEIRDPNNSWAMVDTIAHWLQYGDRLDAYILVCGPVLTAGVRYGPEGHHYLSGMFSLPGLWDLVQRSRSLDCATGPREGRLPGS